MVQQKKAPVGGRAPRPGRSDYRTGAGRSGTRGRSTLRNLAGTRVALPRGGVLDPTDAHLLLRALGLTDSGLRRLAVRVARRLEAVGGLPGLWRTGSEGLGGLLDAAAEARLDAMIAMAERAYRGEIPPGPVHGPDGIIAALGAAVGLEDTERFRVVFLDARGRILGVEVVAQGTLTECLVHPREIFGPAIRARAASVVLVHNHPSGDPTPSDEDLRVTERVAEAGHIVGIPLVDHLVVGRNGYRSVALPPLRCVEGS